MSAVHGVGPLTVLFGALLAFFGFITAGRISTMDVSNEAHWRRREGNRYVLRSIPVLKRIGWVGVAVTFVGLLVWAVHH